MSRMLMRFWLIGIMALSDTGIVLAQPTMPQAGMAALCKREVKYPRTGDKAQDKKIEEMEAAEKADLAKKCAPGGMFAGGLPSGGMARGGPTTSPGGIAASAAANQASGYPVTGKGTVPRAHLAPDNIELTSFDELVDGCKNGGSDMSAAACADVKRLQQQEKAYKKQAACDAKRREQEYERLRWRAARTKADAIIATGKDSPELTPSLKEEQSASKRYNALKDEISKC